ncbi:MAG: UpxY family transcription antiterminator [Bacteroidales bacterium]|nr:UpxY family transcription antiterminator [Bacteroidales bacterium]
MLKDDLLLDSARTPSDELNTDSGCPKNTSAGVLQSCQYSWFALRATYSRELKVRDQLAERGVRTFVPMIWKRCPIKPGMTQTKKLVPAISSLCFVHWTKADIDAYIRSFGDVKPVNYYWDRTKNAPLVVPDKAMEDFITVSSSMDEELIYITDICPKLKEGQSVRVKEGPFKGIEGKVVRIKKSRRILVELPGMVAVATTYITPNELEII